MSFVTVAPAAESAGPSAGAWFRFPLWQIGRLAPGLVCVALYVAYAFVTGVAPWQSLLYLGTLLVAVTGPGWLVWRSIAKPTVLIADLALATMVGLLLQLLWWVVLIDVAPARAQWLPVALTYALFAIVPALRRAYRPVHYRQHLSRLGGWMLVLAIGTVALFFAWETFESALPTERDLWYQDLYWHLANAATMTRGFPPGTAQALGVPLHYHWFTYVHMAVMSMLTGIGLPTVVLKLWVLPIIAVVAGLFVAVLRQLTGQPGAGVLAALLFAYRASIPMSNWLVIGGSTPALYASPTQDYSLVFVLSICYFVVRAVRRGHLSAGEWVVTAVLLLTAQGMKSSTLPLVVCALALASLVSLLTRRRVRITLTLLGASVVALGASMAFLGGGDAGVKLQLFAVFRKLPVWVRYTGISKDQQYYHHGAVIPGLGVSGAWLVLALILVALVVKFAYAALGWPLLRRGRPEAWFLLGLGLAGLGAMLVIDHEQLSQIYFMASGVLGLHVLAAWGLWTIWRAGVRRLGLPVAAVTAFLGADLGAAVTRYLYLAHIGVPQKEHLISAMVKPTLVVALIATAWISVLAVLARRRRVAAFRLLSLACASFVAAAACIQTAQGTEGVPTKTWHRAFVHGMPYVIMAGAALAAAVYVVRMITKRWATVVPTLAAIGCLVALAASGFVPGRLAPKPTPSKALGAVTSAEQQAAVWISANTAKDAVVATNVHCIAIPQTPNCDSRAFFVGGLTERQMYLESWGYIDSVRKLYGSIELPSVKADYTDQAVYRLNEAAFSAPSASTLAELKSKGVDYLYADNHRGPISSALRGLADEVYRNADVTVYRLR